MVVSDPRDGRETTAVVDAYQDAAEVEIGVLGSKDSPSDSSRFRSRSLSVCSSGDALALRTSGKTVFKWVS